mgnify:FL=1
MVEGLSVRSSVVASQVEIHAQFGGVVPELASRHHLTAVIPVVREAIARAGVRWDEVDAIAVTEGPGLVGAVLVGVQVARGLSLATGRPLVGVHHMEGHLVSPFLGDAEREVGAFVPHLALSVSGGHSEIVHVHGLGSYSVLGRTRDDAAGEAFDKAAKLLGLGYPGGPVIDRLAGEGDPSAVPFPRAMLERDNLEFSFSGLKTAVAVYVDQHGQPSSRQQLADVCASFQAAVVSVLIAKLRAARRKTQASLVTIVGGVSANRGLRRELERAAAEDGFAVRMPPLRYCGDNAAMIGGAAALRWAAGLVPEPPVEVYASLGLDEGRARP